MTDNTIPDPQTEPTPTTDVDPKSAADANEDESSNKRFWQKPRSRRDHLKLGAGYFAGASGVSILIGLAVPPSADADEDSASTDVDPEPEPEPEPELEETVVHETSSTRFTDYFEVTRGQEMQVIIENIRGIRTHVAINKGYDSIFSEGVLDGRKSWRIPIEESGIYSMIFDPADDRYVTRGKVKIILYTSSENNHTIE